MSASNRSDAVRSRISFNSSYGMGLSASDHEDNWTEGDCSGMEKVDYWFAHKYFQCVTAQHLVCQEGFMVDMAEIDVSHDLLTSPPNLTDEVSFGNHVARIPLSDCNETTHS